MAKDKFFGANLPPGGLILDGAKKLEPPKTQHEHTFQSCVINIFAALGEENECIGYLLTIFDPHERSTYNFSFGPDLKDNMLHRLEQMPEIGEVPSDA